MKTLAWHLQAVMRAFLWRSRMMSERSFHSTVWPVRSWMFLEKMIENSSRILSSDQLVTSASSTLYSPSVA